MKSEQKKYILDNADKQSIKKISQELNLKERKVRKFLEGQKSNGKQNSVKDGIRAPIRKRSLFLSIVLIILLGSIVYANSFKVQFIWDDPHLIEKNAYIKDSSYIPQIFSDDLGSGGGKEFNFYRPIQLVSYMIDYSFWKLDVRGYHLTNILLHVLVALTIYGLINALFKDNLLSLWTALFYVVHPVHTEVVTYISGRADSLSLFFMLICFLVYVKSLSSKRIIPYIFILLSYTLALLSRENSLILPFLLLVYHYCFKKKVPVDKFFLISCLAVIYALLRLTVLKGLLPQANIATTTFFQRLPGVFTVITDYIRLLFLPINLHMEYGVKLFSLKDVRVILGAIILIAMIIYGLRKREENKLFLFGILWFLTAFIPVSNLYPLNAYMAEHWLYLPSIGFFLIMAKALTSLYCSKKFKVFSVVITAGLLCFYSYLTIKQNRTWQDSIQFYERTLKYAPQSSRLYNNLGLQYMNTNRKEDAVAAYKKAIEIKPNNAEAHNNLGNVYDSIGELEDARIYYEKAIEINPNYAQAYNNLGNIYEKKGEQQQAINSYKKAIELEPNNADSYINLGIIFAALNKNEEAIKLFEKAIKLRPDFAEAYYNLGVFYSSLLRTEEAVKAYQKALELKPDLAEAKRNLSAILSR